MTLEKFRILHSTLEKFRILHSTLIEHYQFMEAHLEGIYAALSDKPFSVGVQEVEKDSLSGVVREIREMEKEKGIKVLTGAEYEQLRQIIQRRNYWCHCCYFEMAFDMEPAARPRSGMSRPSWRS